MTIPPPFIRSRVSRKAMYYVLVEPYDGGGRVCYRYHDLSGTTDPRVALARGLKRQRERIAWAGESPQGESARVIATMQAKLDALASAIEKFEASWIDNWEPGLEGNASHSGSGGSGATGSQG